MGRLDDIIRRNKGTIEQIDLIEGRIDPSTHQHFKNDPVRWGLILKVAGVVVIPIALIVVVVALGC